MAYLHKHDDNNHPHNLPLSIHPQTHQFPHPLHQSHSVSGSIQHNPLFDSDRISRVIEPNNDINSIDFDVGFGLGFVLDNINNNNSHNPNCDDDFNSGCIVADSDDSSQGLDSDEAHETDIISLLDGDCDDEETSFHLCWDSFHIQDNNQITPTNPNPNPISITNSNSNSNSNAYVNEDFEWEEVDDRIDEREALGMFFGDEPDDDASVSPVLLTGFAQVEQPREQNDDALEWQVLSNVHDFGPDTDSEDEDQHDEYNYAEYEMFFGQFGDSDVASSGRPPASKSVVGNLSTVVMTQEDVVNDNALCAVCKDAVAVGEMATQLPCSHRYHGDCILPWLAVRNTCPVCRYELLTDDLDYERRKAERGG